MGLTENRKKSSEYAAYMKKMGIRRTSGACPMGCGMQVMNGGPALISHLGRCKGPRRRR